MWRMGALINFRHCDSLCSSLSSSLSVGKDTLHHPGAGEEHLGGGRGCITAGMSVDLSGKTSDKKTILLYMNKTVTIY